jgi:hypothetical protein
VLWAADGFQTPQLYHTHIACAKSHLFSLDMYYGSSSPSDLFIQERNYSVHVYEEGTGLVFDAFQLNVQGRFGLKPDLDVHPGQRLGTCKQGISHVGRPSQLRNDIHAYFPANYGEMPILGPLHDGPKSSYYVQQDPPQSEIYKMFRVCGGLDVYPRHHPNPMFAGEFKTSVNIPVLPSLRGERAPWSQLMHYSPREGIYPWRDSRLSFTGGHKLVSVHLASPEDCDGIPISVSDVCRPRATGCNLYHAELEAKGADRAYTLMDVLVDGQPRVALAAIDRVGLPHEPMGLDLIDLTEAGV